MATFRVAIVDEHDIFRRGLAAALEESAETEVVFAEPRGPVSGSCDVVVASRDGARTIEPGPPLVLCVDTTRRHPGAFGGTVHAVLSRSSVTPEQLTAAVQAAALGFRLESSARPSPHPLDERARAVLRLLASGAQTREISEELGYSERTIKSVIKGLQDQLGARSRAHVVALGIRDGLI